MEIISVNHNRCNLCGICVETCGQHIFLMKEKEVRIQREETCITCGQCVSVCAQEAIRHKGLNIQGFFPVREELKISPEQMYHFLRSRRSVRTFEPREVPREMLERLVDIGRYAPTGTNIQDVELILIQQSAQIAKLSRMAGMFYGRYLRKLEDSRDPIPYHTARRMDSFRLYYQYALEGKDRVFRGGQAAILVHAPEANAVAADVDQGTCLVTRSASASVGSVSIILAWSWPVLIGWTSDEAEPDTGSQNSRLKPMPPHANALAAHRFRNRARASATGPAPLVNGITTS